MVITTACDIGIYTKWCAANGYDPLTIDKKDCRKWPDDMKKTGNMDSSIGRRMASIQAMYKWLVMMDLCLKNPTGLFETVQLKRSDRRLSGLSHEERELALKTLRFESLHDWLCSMSFLVMYLTGMRRKECANLKWSDIRWEDGELDVIGKGSKPLTKIVLPMTAEKLKAFRALPEIAELNNPYVFPGYDLHGNLSKTKHADDVSIYNWFKETGRWSGLINRKGGYSPHSARRSFCQKLIDTNTSLPDAQVLMGHSSSATTNKYFERNRKQVNLAGNKAFE